MADWQLPYTGAARSGKQRQGEEGGDDEGVPKWRTHGQRAPAERFDSVLVQLEARTRDPGSTACGTAQAFDKPGADQ